MVLPEAPYVAARIRPGQRHPHPFQECPTRLDVTKELGGANLYSRNVAVSMGTHKHSRTEECLNVMVRQPAGGSEICR